MLLVCSRCGGVRSKQPYRSTREVKVVCTGCSEETSHVSVSVRKPVVVRRSNRLVLHAAFAMKAFRTKT